MQWKNSSHGDVLSPKEASFPSIHQKMVKCPFHHSIPVEHSTDSIPPKISIPEARVAALRNFQRPVTDLDVSPFKGGDVSGSLTSVMATTTCTPSKYKEF